MSIAYIDIIAHSHADYGYTDHREVAGLLQLHSLDQALDAIEDTKSNSDGERFIWTAEALDPVLSWWKQAGESRRALFLDAIDRGQMEVCGYPFNATAFLNAAQWDNMFKWMPDELYDRFRIHSAMQIDVSGIPIAGAQAAYKKGIRNLLAGPNSYMGYGGAPFPTPSAFLWEMPEGGDMLVYLNAGYGNAHNLFQGNWRQGPVPAAADLCYRPPHRDDIFAADEESLKKAHELCRKSIALLDAASGTAPEEIGAKADTTQFSYDSGYRHKRLIVTLTNQWRVDNDPPFPPIVDFVRGWNALGLKPVLRLSTLTQSLAALTQELESPLPRHTGEWTDWWANGVIASPRELAAARKAKRTLQVIDSGLFGELNKKESARRGRMLQELCLYDEHTFGSWASAALPYDERALGERYEKSCLAYRSLASAEFLLSEKVRAKLSDVGNGIYVTNPSNYPISDWIHLPANCLRSEYTHVTDSETGVIHPLCKETGPDYFAPTASAKDFSYRNLSRTFPDQQEGKVLRFWTGELLPGQTKRYALCNSETNNRAVRIPDHTEVEFDQLGWPIFMAADEKVLFAQEIGAFLSLNPAGLSPRWAIKEIFTGKDEAERISLKERIVQTVYAEYATAETLVDTAESLVVRQRFFHPSLEWGERTIQIWREQSRIRLTMRLNRKLSDAPETYFIRFHLPCEGVTPLLSGGGHTFKPGRGQLPNSCMDYYAIDGWVLYDRGSDGLLWASKESAMITFGSPKVGAKIKKPEECAEMLYAYVFDNTWDTNFQGNASGDMEFTFELALCPPGQADSAQKRADSLACTPVVLVNV